MKGLDMKSTGLALSCMMLILFLLVSCEKISYEWVKYHDDQDGNIYFYKKGDVDKDGGKHLAQVWGKEIYSEKGRKDELQSRAKDGLSNAGYDKLSYKKCLYEIDCNKSKISILTILHYNKDEKELYSGGSDIRKWFDIEPGSTGDKLQKAVCKK